VSGSGTVTAIPVPHLAVEKRPFLNALKSLRISIRARQKDEAIISYSDEMLTIKLQDAMVQVPATGTWSGSAKIVARTLIPIVTFPPDPDPLPLTFRDDRFYIAGWSVNGSWHPGGVQDLSLPEDATCLDRVALRRRYSDRELEDSGLLQQVRAAEQTVKTQVTHAASVLHDLGITESDLHELVERKLDGLVGD